MAVTAIGEALHVVKIANIDSAKKESLPLGGGVQAAGEAQGEVHIVSLPHAKEAQWCATAHCGSKRTAA